MYLRTLFLACLTTLLLLKTNTTQAQPKSTTHEPMIWMELVESIRLNDRFSATLLYQHRIFLNREETHQNIYWISGNMNLAKPLKLSVGLIYFQYHKMTNDNYLTVPEVRPFQALTYAKNIGKFKTVFRFMLEERYLSKVNQGEIMDGHNFNLRYRSRLNITYPISKELKITISEEFLVNGQQMSTDRFGQNRASARVYYHIGHFDFNIGYLNWLVNTTNELQHRHTLLVGVKHKL